MTLEDFEGRCEALAWALDDYPDIVARDIGDLFNIVKE